MPVIIGRYVTSYYALKGDGDATNGASPSFLLVSEFSEKSIAIYV